MPHTGTATAQGSSCRDPASHPEAKEQRGRVPSSSAATGWPPLRALAALATAAPASPRPCRALHAPQLCSDPGMTELRDTCFLSGAAPTLIGCHVGHRAGTWGSLPPPPPLSVAGPGCSDHDNGGGHSGALPGQDSSFLRPWRCPAPARRGPALVPSPALQRSLCFLIQHQCHCSAEETESQSGSDPPQMAQREWGPAGPCSRRTWLWTPHSRPVRAPSEPVTRTRRVQLPPQPRCLSPPGARGVLSLPPA
ncbi:uncharacterized protein LOC104848253 [Fukomys damarensis]|uniref:uncharacterized protein LOC104848253 n=1 Tax=Fukomys damarensis TaxID=885580 RepID=UPI00053F56CE|nr:uncharacterized protein LOC104848253 [Fukomys damarensis]